MTDNGLIRQKLMEVEEEMKLTGLWKNETPAWVKDFEKRAISTGEDFMEWLQFIYFPNRIRASRVTEPGNERNYIVPQAIKFFSSDIKKGKLLQLLIELDSLS